MTQIRIAFAFCFLMVFAPVAFAQRPPDPKVEIYIPAGMPIQIEATRDENEQTITKYNIRRIVGPEVSKVGMVMVVVGANDEVLHTARGTTARVSDPASIAWASQVDARRLLIIVEWVEADTGTWVLDSEDQHANLHAIVERGSDALPRAKFIKKE